MVDKKSNLFIDAINAAKEKSRTPDFLKNENGEKRKDAATDLKNAEKTAGSSLIDKTSSVPAKPSLGKSLGGLYKGKSIASKVGKSSKGKFGIKKGPTIAAVALIVLVLLLLIPSIPFFAIGMIDHNLQDAVGFSGASAIIEEIALRIVAEKTAKGEIPTKIANDFAEQGLVFGQVTKNGDFVRTNKYLANVDESTEVAATGLDFYQHANDGELAVLYNGKIIDAKDLVLAVESDSELYEKYMKAVERVVASHYYGEDVSKEYEDLGLNRSAFFNWTITGDEEEDEKSYYEAVDEILEGDVSTSIASCEGDLGTECEDQELKYEEAISDAENLGGNTNRASQLLNMAVSSIEPQKAARAFLAIEEPLQRARLDGTGPVNQVMNALNRQTEVQYVDVNTNESVSVRKSILETTNFSAAVSGGGYSIEEANNFSRDRVLIATKANSDDEIGEVIRDSMSEDDSASPSTSILKKKRSDLDNDAVSRADDSIKRATEKFDNNKLTSVLGGNRALEGGSFLANRINQRVLGAMPSDASAIASYQQEVDRVLALRANAERATLSPFDTSSPNTFLGNIYYRIAGAYINHSSRGDAGVVSAVGTIADLTSDSAGTLLSGAVADGNDTKFTTIAGDCKTVSQAANVVGDLYCNAHNTITTKYKDYTREQWENALGDDIDKSGEPAKDSEFEDFVADGTLREATVGVKSSVVCDRHKNWFEAIMEKLDIFGIFGYCNGHDDITTGSKFTLSDQNSYKGQVELYGGYLLYDHVDALIEDTKSSLSLFKEKYYKEHPLDNSPAGRIARMSGMTKDEAKLALSYASYLARIRNYSPLERYAFGGPHLKIDNQPLIIDDAEIKEMVYCYWRGKSEYFDLRNKSHVA